MGTDPHISAMFLHQMIFLYFIAYQLLKSREPLAICEKSKIGLRVQSFLQDKDFDF